MSAPGWYPDPSGQPGFRWWDGRAWSTQTSPTAGAPPLVGAPVVGGGGAGGGGVGGQSSGGGRRLGPVLAVVVVVAVLALVAALVLPRVLGRSETADPGPQPTSTVSAWDETSRPTPTPTPSSPEPSSGGGELEACPTGDPLTRQDHPADGRIHGGGLSQEPVPGWPDWTPYGYLWAYDAAGQADPVLPDWIASTTVGAISIADGFAEPQQSAVDMMECLATSDYYQGITGRTDVVSQAVTIDGRPGWWLRSEIRVAGRDVEGDIADVVVVDDGNGESLSFFSSCAPIDDTERIALIDAARESLRIG